jgi:hypothetical protein
VFKSKNIPAHVAVCHTPRLLHEIVVTFDWYQSLHLMVAVSPDNVPVRLLSNATPLGIAGGGPQS